MHKNLRQEDLSAFFIASDINEDGLISLEEYVEASLNEDAATKQGIPQWLSDAHLTATN